MTGQAAITIRRDFKRIRPDQLTRLSGFPTGYFVDVQGRRGALHFGIGPVFDAAPFIGSALTVKTVPDDNLAPYVALDLMQPGDVLLIATGDWTGSAVIGDLAVGMFKNAGVAGVVTDGVVRDVAGLEALGIPVHARGLSPNSPQKNGPGEIGGEIAIGGGVVRAGDLIIGDRDGVVVVPQDRLDSLEEALLAIKAKEARIENDIAAGISRPDWIEAFLASGGVTYVDE